MKRVGSSLIWTVFLLQSGCVEQVSEYTSSGPSIVENETACSKQPSFTLAAFQEIDGSDTAVDDGAELVFGQIAAAFALSDGRLIVADGFHNKILSFSPEGRLLNSTGKEGEGPGEFRRIRWAGRCAGDSIYVFDSGLRRISVLNSDLGHARSFSLSTLKQGRVADELRCDGSGNILARLWFSPNPEQKTGPYRPSSTFVLFDRNGSERRVVGVYPSDERYRYVRGSSRRYLGRRTMFDYADSKIVIGLADSFEFLLIKENGEPGLIVRSGWIPRPITDDDVESYIAQRVDEMPEEWKSTKARLWRSIDFPSYYPPYQAIKGDTEGRIWVKEYPAVSDTMVEWRVFSADGLFLGRTALSTSAILTDIRRSTGVAVDNFRVTRYDFSVPICESDDQLFGAGVEKAGINSAGRTPDPSSEAL